MVEIEGISEKSLVECVRMAHDLWPGNEMSELQKQLANMMNTDKHAVFVAKHAGGEYIGFIHVSIREDYVQGSTSSPVGYIEGIYVKEAHRKEGVAKLLAQRGECWAKLKGCRQFASDIEAGNTESYHFHIHTGFRDAGTIICLIKEIE